MKKQISFLVSFFVLVSSVYAQRNNPYNSKGQDAINIIIALTKDYKSKKLSDYSPKTIKKYADLYGIDTSQVGSMIPTLYTAATDPNFDYTSTINNTNVSSYVKSQGFSLINITQNSSVDSIKTLLIDKVDEISNSTATQSDKEILLTICALLYNFANSSDPNLSSIANRNETGAAWGTAIGIVLGGIAGAPFCGAPCSFVGSLIFGFVGNLAGGLSS